MNAFDQYEVWFVTGAQLLYGGDAVVAVDGHSTQMVNGLNASGKLPVKVVYKGTANSSKEVEAVFKAANNDEKCIGVITWMHTFSPAKMWIHGLQQLKKPLLHLHTQFNKEIPWDTMDMDFMNLNQSAHGDREFGHICTRMRIRRKVVVGYWQDEDTQHKIAVWMRVCAAWADAQDMLIIRFGDQMNNVAVTDGDKVEAEQRMGYHVDYCPVSELMQYHAEVKDADVEALVKTYFNEYDHDAALEDKTTEAYQKVWNSAKAELALRAILKAKGAKGFTTNFDDLGQTDGSHFDQIPGLASQRLMADGYGFGAEGDWKTAALLRIMKVMSTGLQGGTSFMEDYTYHFEKGNDLVLGSHMLEVCPSIAVEEKPILDVQHLGIGGKDDPARLIFNTQTGPAIVASLIDLGDRYRLLVNCIDTVKTPHTLPKLPVANALWKAQPDLPTASEAWILAGGAHHTVFSHALNLNDMRQFAEMHDIEITVIDNDTRLPAFKDALRWNEVYYGFRR